MNMFRQSELNDDELIQANRLDEALDQMFQTGESEIDQREDPELSELTSMGELLRASSDEATSRNSFHSFHMRSRSALLHRISESSQSSRESGFLGSVFDFIRVRSAIMSGAGASIVTAFAFLLISNFGGTPSAAIEVTNAGSTDSSSSASSSSALQVSSKQQQSSQSQTNVSPLSVSSTDLNSSNSTVSNTTISGDILDTSKENQGAMNIITTASSVEAIEASPYSLSIKTLESAIESLEAASMASSVSVDAVRQVTDELARVGFEMRSGHPGSKTAGDIENFQNAIVRAILLLQNIEQSDKDVQASLIAAKIVAEEGMHIATTYVNANQASR
jgi:hypothetical protein